MQTTTTTCDRCGKTTDDAGLDWNCLYVDDLIDLCPDCTKALRRWIDTTAALVVKDTDA